MGRWQPDARERLVRAALELFAEVGFAETTVPAITARAGLTTRTFFRHFADKREVLFAGEDDLPVVITAMIHDAPAHFTPWQLIEAGLDTVMNTRFEGRLAELRLRAAVVATDTGLQERELRKMAVLADAMASAFEHRGVDPLTSRLTAEMTASVFRVAIERWLQQPSDKPLRQFMHGTLRAMRGVVDDKTVSPERPGPVYPPGVQNSEWTTW